MAASSDGHSTITLEMLQRAMEAMAAAPDPDAGRMLVPCGTPWLPGEWPRGLWWWNEANRRRR